MSNILLYLHPWSRRGRTEENLSQGPTATFNSVETSVATFFHRDQYTVHENWIEMLKVHLFHNVKSGISCLFFYYKAGLNAAKL